MALFKIFKGQGHLEDLNEKRPSTVEGYCYFTPQDGKFYIDIVDDDNLENNPAYDPRKRVVLNAGHADTAAFYSEGEVGSESIPIYINSAGQPLPCGDILSTNISGGLVNAKGELLDIGNSKLPIYFSNGKPTVCDDTLNINITGNAPTADHADETDHATMADEAQIAYAAHYLSDQDNNSLNIGEPHIPVYFVNGVPVKCTNFLPLSAGEDYKLTGSLGLTEDHMYGKVLPETGFTGQLFFKEDDSLYMPSGGNAGQVLIKNSTTDGDASWKELVALPKGGVKGQALIKNSETDGDGVWTNSNITWTGGTSAGPKPKIFGTDGDTIPSAGASASGIVTTGAQTFAGVKTFNSAINSSLTTGTWLAGNQGTAIINSTAGAGYNALASMASTNGRFTMASHDANFTLNYTANSTISAETNSCTYRVTLLSEDGSSTFNKLYGAVWNDYAEYRAQKEIIEPGYCVASSNNGQVYKTTEKFQACDGIVSDTFGFAIGETDECKTPLAVAGRVLAYCEGDRYDYHSGDTVCAGPNGKVCKMTREEIREWPDRIIGIVSEIPEYERWGDGNVPVNGRIWIKVK